MQKKRSGFHIIVYSRVVASEGGKELVIRTRSADTALPVFRKKAGLRSRASPGQRVWEALISGAIPVAVLGAAPYLVGRAYHTTLLQSLGINPELYPKMSTDYFVHAYYAWLICVGKVLPFMTEELTGIIAIVLFWTVITVLALASLYIDRLQIVERLRAKLLQANRLKRATKIVVIPMLGSALTFNIPFLIMFGYISPILIGETAGKASASFYTDKVARLCKAPGTATSYCTEILENGRLVGYGFVIDASENHIALLEKGRGRSIQRAGKEFFTRYAAARQPDSTKR